MSEPVVLVPLRGFGGMSRLADVLDPSQRSAMARDLAGRVVAAALDSGCDVLTITGSTEVEAWASHHGVGVLEDPGDGLNEAATAAVAAVRGRPWMVVHADLPFVHGAALREVREAIPSGTVLVPSLDGGTNVVAGTGTFRFSFGPGSFHKHLASVPTSTVLPSAALSIDIDTAIHLSAVGRLAGTSSPLSSLPHR